MIQKLESAGLGFFIKATETQERIGEYFSPETIPVSIYCRYIIMFLGKIPLRQLVYRVHNLPPSMRPLVYDFGQLQHQREADYTDRIVHNYVRWDLFKNADCLLVNKNLSYYLHFILQNQKHLNPKLSDYQVSSVARILTFCQQYMRKREVSTTDDIFKL